MEALKYQFTVKFTVIQYFQMLFELVSKVLPFYMVSFIITTILSVTVVGELSIIGMITFFKWSRCLVHHDDHCRRRKFSWCL